MFYNPFYYLEPETETYKKAVATFIPKRTAENPGGVMVADPHQDINPGAPIGRDESGIYRVIPCAMVKSIATKGENVQVFIEDCKAFKSGDYVAGQGIECTKIVEATTGGTNSPGFLTLERLTKPLQYNAILYKANPQDEGKADARPVYKPEFVTGAPLFEGQGAQAVAAVNVATIWRDNAVIAEEIAALMPGIHLIY